MNNGCQATRERGIRVEASTNSSLHPQPRNPDPLRPSRLLSTAQTLPRRPPKTPALAAPPIPTCSEDRAPWFPPAQPPALTA